MSGELPSSIYDVETPCFLVDIDRVKNNTKRMRDSCEKMGLRLRPHTKTHKTLEGAELCTAGTKRGIVCSTLAEVEFFANNGYDDILWAHPMVKERISKRLIEMRMKLEELHLMVDSVGGMEGLIATPLTVGKKWSVFLEIDCGNGRTGCAYDSEDVIKIAKMAVDSPNTEFQGIYTHCGNTYRKPADEKRKIQQETVDRILAARDRLKAAGIECKHYELGSTPGCSPLLDTFSKLSGVHPGNYIFHDYLSVFSGGSTMEDIACKVATTVISHKPELGTMIVDCGWTALSQDGMYMPMDEMPLGYAPIVDHPELRMGSMSQELGKIVAAEGQLDYSKYPLGTRFFLYPHHSCATANNHRKYYIHSGDKIVGVWRPVSGF